MTETLSAPPLAATAVDPTVGFRRRTAAIALPLAFAFQVACNSIYASSSSGLSDTGSTAEMLKMYGLFPSQVIACVMLAQIGSLLAVLGLPAALRVLRPAKPRLALWAVALMVAGYVSYFGICFADYVHVALGAAHVDAAAALDASPATPWSAAFFLLFVAGNLGGTLLLGLAVILGGRRVGVPWWAGVLILGWPVGHIVNLVGGGEWFAVGGGVLEVVGLALVTAAALRLSNPAWIARG